MSDIRFNQWLHQSGTGGVSQVDGGHVGIGTTNPDIAVHSANAKKLNVGIVTANSIYAGNFYGNGSNLSGLAADKIIEGDTKVEVVDAGSQYISAEVNGSERLRIDSSGNVTIKDAKQLLFENDAQNASSAILNLGASGTSNLIFATAGAEKVRIDSSGRLLVGTTTEGSSAADDLTISGSGEVGMTIRSTNSSQCNIFFSDGTSGAAEYAGVIRYDHSTNSMRVWTNGDSEKLRIKSDGEVNLASDVVFTNSSWTGNKSGKIQQHSNILYIQGGSSGIKLRSSNGSDETIFSGRKIEVEGGRASNDDAMIVHVLDTYHRKIQFAEATDAYAVGQYGGFIGYDAANNYMTLGTNQAGTVHEGMRFHRSGGYVTKPAQPCCMAYNAQGQHMAGGAIAQFNSTRFNIGSHYNSSNGRFTAPIAGRYLVAYSGLHDYQNQNNAGFAIRLNGSEFDGGEAYDDVYGSSNAHQCQLAKTLILNMNANDYVQIYIRQSGTQVHQRYGSFSVCLLT